MEHLPGGVPRPFEMQAVAARQVGGQFEGLARSVDPRQRQ